MKISFDGEQIIREKDLCKIIFNRRKTQRACRIFLEWLKERGGWATKYAVSQFADSLKEGKHLWQNAPFRYSRRNFYMTILKRLLGLGLLEIRPHYMERDHSTHFVYSACILDIPQRPPAQGFWKYCYYLSRHWNREFEADRNA